MKVQLLPLVALFATQAFAACGNGESELFDLQVTDGTSQCGNFGCYKACTFPDGSGSCNGCTRNEQQASDYVQRNEAISGLIPTV
ncbi:hypothetical protein RB213_009935 [Colletotrichum asianum]